MSYTLDDVRKAMARIIDQKTTANVYTYAQVRDRGNFPAVIIEPDTSDFAVSFQMGTDEWDFKLYVLVRCADEAIAQQQLDSFITGRGPDSIRQAIVENSSLGLDGVSAHVYGMLGYGHGFHWEGTAHIGAILKARVIIQN